MIKLNEETKENQNKIGHIRIKLEKIRERMNEFFGFRAEKRHLCVTRRCCQVSTKTSLPPKLTHK